jgi:hypothetical protein
MDDVVAAAGLRLGSYRCVHGGRDRGPVLSMSPAVEAELIKFEQVLERDSIAPKTLGISAGMPDGLRAAAVAKRRTKLQLAAASAAAQAMGAGLHTSLSSPGVNCLRMLHGSHILHGDGMPILKLRAERFTDGIMAEQQIQNWCTSGGWRTHNRYPVELQTTRGPWAGTQDKSTAYTWLSSFVMGSQADAVPVAYVGEATDDALTVEGNSEIAGIKTTLLTGEAAMPTLDGLSRAGRLVAAAGVDEDGEEIEAEYEVRHSTAAAVKLRDSAVKAEETRRSAEASRSLLRVVDGGFQTRAGGLSVTVATVSTDAGPGSVGLVAFKTTALWKVRGLEVVANADGTVSCPELEIFNDAALARMVAGTNDGEVPDMFLFAAQLCYRLSALGHPGPNGTMWIDPPPPVIACVWRHYCHQMRGTGAETAALVAFSSLLLVRPEPTGMAAEATVADVDWLGRVTIGRAETTGEARAGVRAASGLNAFAMHSARTEIFLGTCSPLTVYYVENQAIVRHPGTVPLYERNSVEGIRAACAKIAVVRCLHVDRDAASVGVGAMAYMTGMGFADLGAGSFGPAVLQAQVRGLESQFEEYFNGKFEAAWSVTVDLARPHASTLLGSAAWERTRRVTVCGDPPERYPPYIWSTMVGSGVEYLPPSTIPDLSSSQVIDPTLDGSDGLVHGHVVSVSGGALGRPLFLTEPGTGAEDVANPPYRVVASNGSRLGPRENGAGVFTTGSYWAARFDAAFVGRPGQVALHDFSRTMGSLPYASTMRDLLLDSLVDLPLRRSSHAAHCLTNVCVPQCVRSGIARALPVPTGAAARAVSCIFR